MTDDPKGLVAVELVDRVKLERQRQRLSHRRLGSITGISFSTLARVERGEGSYDTETERRLRAWLGEDVGHLVSAAEQAKAQELGMLIARSCSSEIQSLVIEATRAKDAEIYNLKRYQDDLRRELEHARECATKAEAALEAAVLAERERCVRIVEGYRYTIDLSKWAAEDRYVTRIEHEGRMQQIELIIAALRTTPTTGEAG